VLIEAASDCFDGGFRRSMAGRSTSTRIVAARGCGGGWSRLASAEISDIVPKGGCGCQDVDTIPHTDDLFVLSGTHYRLDLIEVVLVEHIAELVELGRRLLAVEGELEAISTWLHAALMSLFHLASASVDERRPPQHRLARRPLNGDLGAVF
jgi:hypothetical protein